jgi:hypothetical protein
MEGKLMMMMNSFKMIILASILPIALAACGGGGGGGGVVTPTPTPQPLQQKTATITFSTVASTPTAPLQGIQITAKLPAGATITDSATALTGQSSVSQVTALNYSAANQTVTFGVLPATQNGIISFGPFAALKCDITPGVTLTENSFVSANTPFPDLQMTGVINGNTVDLVHPVQQIPVTMSVTFVSQ